MGVRGEKRRVSQALLIQTALSGLAVLVLVLLAAWAKIAKPMPPLSDARAAQLLAEEFPGGVKLQYNLHPPMLRALGMTRKLRFGKWFDGVFRALVGMRKLRGTALDPFGRAHVRRVERALPAEYRGLIDKALVDLGPDTYDRALKLAALPDVIRGYEDIKLRNVEKFRDDVKKLGY